MFIRVLELFRRNRITVYAIPAHTSGKTKPLYVVAFAVYKLELNDLIQQILRADQLFTLDMFNSYSKLTRTNNSAISRANIQAYFKLSGM